MSDIDRYVADLRTSYANSQAADHRPAYAEDFAPEEQRARRLYAVGTEFQKTLSIADVSRCKKLREKTYRGWACEWELCEFEARGKRMVAPHWLAFLDRVDQLREVVS